MPIAHGRTNPLDRSNKDTKGDPFSLELSASTDGCVNMTWETVPIEGIKEYRIYRSIGESGGFTHEKTTTNNTYNDWGIQPGETYSYKISAVTNDGRESDLRNQEGVQTKALGWREVHDGGPSERARHSAVHDNSRNQMVVFGGIGKYSYISNDVWAFDLAAETWMLLHDGRGYAPAKRYGHTAVYDVLRDWMIVFGGSDGTFSYNDTWAFDFMTGDWLELHSGSGNAPHGRSCHISIFATTKDAMVVSGGLFSSSPYKDLWAFDIENRVWDELHSESGEMSERWDHSAVYNVFENQMIVFGGYGWGQKNDMWSYDFDIEAWQEIDDGNGIGPSVRSAHATCFDEINKLIIVFGGDSPEGFRADTWGFDTSIQEWRILQDGYNQYGWFCHSMVYDSERERVLMFGGYHDSSTQPKKDVRAFYW